MFFLIFCTLESEFNQVKSLISSIDNIPENRFEDTPVSIVIDFIGPDNTSRSEMLKFPIQLWKSKIEQVMRANPSLVYFKLDDRLLKLHLDIEIDDLKNIKCLDENGNMLLIPALTFMRFLFEVSPQKADPMDDMKVLPLLVESFSHELSEIGRRTCFRVERELIKRYQNDWITKGLNCLAPLVSLCQSSGSGKSKIALELIKKNLGYYIVFRSTGQTGYPRRNIISGTLKSIISSYRDNVNCLDDILYDKCTVGKILNFIASIIVKYVRDFVELSKIKSFSETVECLGERFQNNESLGLECLIPDEEMDQLYKLKLDPKVSVIKVKSVALFISQILSDPRKCFLENIDSKSENVCEMISTKLHSCPFILAIDEAELLAKETYNQEGTGRIVTGFQILRRALSYLEKETMMMVLTLGTKSNVLDLNPPVEDNSYRFSSSEKSVPEPIILSSNLNILSKEYSVKYLKPSYKLLSNPVFFKYLVTRGHGIWCSLPFNGLVSIGESKIKNGTSETKGYILALWMILTGLAANPLSVEAGTLVSSHMAYLIDLRNKLKNLIVSYPSEPILAIVAHKLIDDLNDDELFAVLKEKFEAVDLNCGSLAETFAEMILLRAIHKSAPMPYYGIHADERRYENFLDEIIGLAPELIDLWESHAHVLEDTPRAKLLSKIGNLARISFDLKDKTDEISINKKKEIDEEKEELMKDLEKFPRLPGLEYRTFKNYEVHTLGGTLSQLCGITRDEMVSNGLPEKVLNAVVTANHFVHLNRFPVESEIVDKLPAADNRIAMKCRTLDDKLLRLAALQHAGLIMEPGYFGYDFAIPYCTEDDTFGFLGVQVKRASSNSTDDIYKMQARFHYVKCINPECVSGVTCPKCTPKNELKFIYENQVSLIISLDSADKFVPFSSHSTKTFMAGLQNGLKAELSEILNQNKPLSILDDLIFVGKSKNFFFPLVQKKMALNNNNVSLSQCIWNDKFVSQKKLKGREDEPFVPDGFNHRQFTFSTRGWKLFENLFTNWKSCVTIANNLLDGPRFFQKSELSTDTKRKLISDFSFSFMDYSDDLALFRGFPSKLDALDRHDKIIDTDEKSAEAEEDENEIGTLIESVSGLALKKRRRNPSGADKRPGTYKGG